MKLPEWDIFLPEDGASCAVLQLRRFVLYLAISGNLNDDFAVNNAVETLVGSLLEFSVNRASKGGRRDESKESVKEIMDGEKPEPFAAYGHFARLRDIAQIRKGPTGIKDAKPGSYPLVVTAEARSTSDHFDFESAAVLIPMVSSTGHGDASLKRIHYQEGKFALGSILCAVQPFHPELVSARYLYEYLGAFKEELLVARMVGTANVSLTVKKIGEVPVPLISPHAQRFVEELMQLCDALEAHGRLQDEQHARLVATLFDALAASESADALADNWQRIATHFDLLLDRPEAVDTLEQTLLQLAVRGLLVPQDSSDESAGDVLRRLSTWRPKGGGEGKYANTNIKGAAAPAAPYELPQQWDWAPLGDLVENMGSGWSPACEDGERSSDDRWAVLRTTAVQVMEFRPREHKATPLKLKGRPGIQVQCGDILITRAGPMNRVGISCWVDNAPARLMLSDKIVRFQVINEEMVPSFIVLALNAGWTKDQIEDAKTGMAASQVNISQSALQKMQIPVCSKAEQQRIVARLEELRHLCAKLRERLQQSRTTQSQLADALVSAAAQSPAC